MFSFLWNRCFTNAKKTTISPICDIVKAPPAMLVVVVNDIGDIGSVEDH